VKEAGGGGRCPLKRNEDRERGFENPFQELTLRTKERKTPLMTGGSLPNSDAKLGEKKLNGNGGTGQSGVA